MILLHQRAGFCVVVELMAHSSSDAQKPNRCTDVKIGSSATITQNLLLCAVKFRKMKIEGKLEVLNIDNWTTNWNDDLEKRNELQELVIDMRKAIHERCGIDISNIQIELKVSD